MIPTTRLPARRYHFRRKTACNTGAPPTIHKCEVVRTTRPQTLWSVYSHHEDGVENRIAFRCGIWCSKSTDSCSKLENRHNNKQGDICSCPFSFEEARTRLVEEIPRRTLGRILRSSMIGEHHGCLLALLGFVTLHPPSYTAS
jgi:hypothetical protein